MPYTLCWRTVPLTTRAMASSPRERATWDECLAVVLLGRESASVKEIVSRQAPVGTGLQPLQARVSAGTRLNGWGQGVRAADPHWKPAGPSVVEICEQQSN